MDIQGDVLWALRTRSMDATRVSEYRNPVPKMNEIWRVIGRKSRKMATLKLTNSIDRVDLAALTALDARLENMKDQMKLFTVME